MDHHHHHQHQHHHHQQQQQQHHYLLPQQQQQQVHHSLQHHQNQNNQGGGGGVISGGVGVDVTDRFPQWSLQETKELLMIRADLDQTFMETKRNKPLWEVIANRMKEKGYNRSPEQCKCKWKNLVTRYKGCETMEAETVRQQFPFYNELQAIFTARMQRMLWAEAEGGGGGGGGGGASGSGLRKNKSLSSDDEDDTNIDIELSEGSEQKAGNVSHTSIKKKLKKMKSIGNSIGGGGGGGGKGLREMLEDFMRQQVQMEAEWREAAEAREKERREKEAEWRQAMKALESERVMMERSWREREEQRRVREEARAEKRDALITVLLNKLRREDV